MHILSILSSTPVALLQTILKNTCMILETMLNSKIHVCLCAIIAASGEIKIQKSPPPISSFLCYLLILVHMSQKKLSFLPEIRELMLPNYKDQIKQTSFVSTDYVQSTVQRTTGDA